MFEAARKLHEQLRRVVSLSSELHSFARRARAMPVKLRQHSLNLLRNSLERRKAGLLSALTDDSEAR